MNMPVLDVENLSIDLKVEGGRLQAVDSIDLKIGAGETVCLVGESGSGKTVTALSIMRLIDYKGGRLVQGKIGFDGRNLATLSQREMSDLRGRRIGIVFQEPMTAFDPLFTIGEQISEVIRRHKKVSPAIARKETITLLQRVRIPDAALRMKQHPHELSGGMRQRAMIAMALACEPQLLVADEPTTALDVTIQAQILTLLRELQAETSMAILLITHDLGVAAEMADRVVVMYAGRVVEDAPVQDLFAQPAHPYTRGLLQSIVGALLPRGSKLEPILGAIPSLSSLPSGCRFHPRCPRATLQCLTEVPPLLSRGAGLVACWVPHSEPMPRPETHAAPSLAIPSNTAGGTRLIEAVKLRKSYPLGAAWFGTGSSVQAVDGVSFYINEGETFGLVGESGCGKSTLARVLLQLERATSGQVNFMGRDLTRLDGSTLRQARRDMQMIFQDPYGSIDPRWTIGAIIGEPLAVHEKSSPKERLERVRELIAEVGLDPAWHARYPHQLSGGQRQRVAIARAIALRPRFVLADEAVSALDTSVQAQVVNLLQDLKNRLGLTYLFIGHGLHVVRHVSDRIGVMYLGRLVEIGPAETLFRHPAHHYTKALLAAIPEPDPKLRREFLAIPGEIPSSAELPQGCRFHPRCAAAAARCKEEEPELVARDSEHVVACHFPV